MLSHRESKRRFAHVLVASLPVRDLALLAAVVRRLASGASTGIATVFHGLFAVMALNYHPTGAQFCTEPIEVHAAAHFRLARWIPAQGERSHVANARPLSCGARAYASRGEHTCRKGGATDKAWVRIGGKNDAFSFGQHLLMHGDGSLARAGCLVIRQQGELLVRDLDRKVEVYF